MEKSGTEVVDNILINNSEGSNNLQRYLYLRISFDVKSVPTKCKEENVHKSLYANS